MNKIAKNISEIKKTIASFDSYPLFCKDIKIVAVSKNQPVEKIEQAIACGINDFGENYIQEAKAKWVYLKEKYPQVRLHLIGHLQRNKAKEALALFDVIQSLDNEKLIKVIANELENNTKNIVTKSFFIQINLDTKNNTNHRSGVFSNKLDDLIYCCKKHNINVDGLMSILPNDNMKYPYFAFLKNLQKNHEFKELSMGMSGDFKQAVVFGATLLRIGTAIFKDY